MKVDEEMKFAVKNVGHDSKQLAHYLYTRCCEYMTDHEQNSEILMVALIEAVKADARRAALEEIEQALGHIFAIKQGKQYCEGFADARNEIQQLICQRASEGV